MKSNIFQLLRNDIVRGFVMAIIGSMLTLLYGVLQNGGSIDWNQIGMAGLLAGIAYLIKNFFSDEEGKVFGAFG